MDRIKGINSKHRILVREHLKFLQSRLYDLTEYDKTKGKFLDFVDVHYFLLFFGPGRPQKGMGGI